MSASTATSVLNGHAVSKLPPPLEKVISRERRATPDSDVVASSDEDHEQNAAMSMSLHSARSMPAARPMRRGSWLSEVHSMQRKYSQGGQPQVGSASTTSSTTPLASSSLGNLAGLGSLNSVGGSQPATPSLEANGAASSSPSASSWDTNSGRPSTGHSAFPTSGWNLSLNPVVWQKNLPSISSPRWSSDSPVAEGPLSSCNLPPSSSPSLLHNLVSSPTSSNQEDLRSPTSTIAFDHSSSTFSHFPPQSSHTSSSVSPSIPFEIPLEPNRKTVRSQSYSSAIKKRVPLSVARRASRPSIFPLDTTSERDLDAVSEVVDSITGDSTQTPSTETASPSVNSSKNNITPTGPLANTTLSTETATPTGPRTVAGHAVNPSPIVPGQSTHDSQDHVDVATMALLAGKQTEAAAARAQSTLANVNESFERMINGRPSDYRPHIASSRDKEMSAIPEEHQAVSRPERGGLNIQNPPARGNEDTLNYLCATGYNPLSASLIGSPRAPRRSLESDQRQHQLYLVSFKSNRSDIFFLPDHFGIEPVVGDLVIVDGDRGEDLGIIQYADISLEEAKSKKALYNRRHYRTLVMFSRLFPHVAAAAAASGDTTLSDPNNTISDGNLASPRGKKDAEPNPKAIRHIASDDEIALLREKEGNEARAKRIAQSKVNEHGFKMEILDTEFQLDYKKLTIYFYAEEYINFNELVGDLFKIWKLRIWLSAVNPASFPPPVALSRSPLVRQPPRQPRGRDGPQLGPLVEMMPFHAENAEMAAIAGAARQIRPMAHNNLSATAGSFVPATPTALPISVGGNYSMRGSAAPGSFGMHGGHGGHGTPFGPGMGNPYGGNQVHPPYGAMGMLYGGNNPGYSYGGGRPANFAGQTAPEGYGFMYPNRIVPAAPGNVHMSQMTVPMSAGSPAPFNATNGFNRHTAATNPTALPTNSGLTPLSHIMSHQGAGTPMGVGATGFAPSVPTSGINNGASNDQSHVWSLASGGGAAPGANWANQVVPPFPLPLGNGAAGSRSQDLAVGMAEERVARERSQRALIEQLWNTSISSPAHR